MDVKFITTLRNLIDTVPIVDGQVITSKDSNDMFYDMYQTRYRVGAPIWDGIGKPKFFNEDGTKSLFKFMTYIEDNPIIEIKGEIGLSTEDIELPILEDMDGYTFVGWYTNEWLTEGPIDKLPEKFPLGAVVYYAGWKRNEDN